MSKNWDLEELGRQLYKRRIKESFYDREKAIVERSREDWVKEQASLTELLAEAVLTEEQMATFEQFAREASGGLDLATFEDKRLYLDWLDFSGRFAWENGEPVLYVRLEMVKGAHARLRDESVTHSRLLRAGRRPGVVFTPPGLPRKSTSKGDTLQRNTATCCDL